ncbi:MAG: hypothetical protein QM760_14525 [Nibricoccus sp.]
MSRLFRAKKLYFSLGVALWLFATAWGAKVLYVYSFTPGTNGQPAEVWPAGAGFSRADGICTLVVALHPECPCSRATVSELATLLEQTTPRLRAIVVFLDTAPDRPAGESELFKTVRQLPGVTVVRDHDGSELERFRFLTSGETRLYRPDGTLAFRGGITPSRGHTGDSPGRAAVIAAVRSPTGSPPLASIRTPAFGCALASAPTVR